MGQSGDPGRVLVCTAGHERPYLELGDSLITDEIVEKAAAACDNHRFKIKWGPAWDSMPESYKEMRRLQIRVALEAVQGDIIERFGACGHA